MPEVKDKRIYELAVVLRADLEQDLKPATEKIAKIVKNAGGEIAEDATFERRALAYKIKGETHGLYGFYRLNLSGDAPNKISAVLNITDEILRYLLTKIDEKAEEILADEKARALKRREAREAENSENNSKTNEERGE